MNERLSESDIVSAVAKAAAVRITRQVIRDLQRMKSTLSGDDSVLKTTWDEICVQIQYEQSFHWEAYDATVYGIVEGYVGKLPKHESDAIWLQSNAGSDWSCEEPEDREPNPVLQTDVVNYIIQEHVYAEAERWSNARIEAYLDQAS